LGYLGFWFNFACIFAFILSTTDYDTGDAAYSAGSPPYSYALRVIASETALIARLGATSFWIALYKSKIA